MSVTVEPGSLTRWCSLHVLVEQRHFQFHCGNAVVNVLALALALPLLDMMSQIL